MDLTIKTRLLLRPVRSPLGAIRLAGMNKGGHGVGMGDQPLRTLKCFAFNLTLSGKGSYRDRDGRTFDVGKGDIAFFFPMIPHGCGTAPGEYWDELWFEFEGPVFDLMLKTGLLDPKRPVRHTRNCETWFRRFFHIIPLVHLRQKTRPEVIVARFVSVLTDILADADAPNELPTPEADWVESSCQLLSNYDKRPDDYVAAVARTVGMSYESFRKKFRQAVGISPGQFHLDARIDRAAALLHQGQNSVKEIAEQLHFCDEFYFSRCFKHRFGQAPREFRQRIRGG